MISTTATPKKNGFLAGTANYVDERFPPITVGTD